MELCSFVAKANNAVNFHKLIVPLPPPHVDKEDVQTRTVWSQRDARMKLISFCGALMVILITTGILMKLQGKIFDT